MNRHPGVWTHRGCAPRPLDYQEQMFEAIRPETPAALVELNVRPLAKTIEEFDRLRPI
jgi:hypothetical protein